MRLRRFLTVLGVVALSSTGVLVAGAPAGAVAVGDEPSFRAAWDTATEITLTADITLTCAGGGDADRSSNAPVVLDGAGHTIRLAAGCLDRVLSQNGDGATTLRNVTIAGGNTNDDGGGYQHDGTGSLTIEASSFVDNTGCMEGGGVEVDNDSVVEVRITGSTFSGNRSGEGSALNIDNGGSLVVVNSTFTGNVTNERGAIKLEVDSGEAEAAFVYATIASNVETTDRCNATGAAPAEVSGEVEEPEVDEPESAPLVAGAAANLDVDEDFAVSFFGTVIADPIGNGSPTPNCLFGDPAPTSLGYNFSDDDTCGFTAGTDTQNGPDPQLGALAANGGPTQTRLPARTSPLVNVIPIAACGGGDGLAGSAVTTDQRGVTRPQETGCEIGSVELEAPVAPIVLEPTFTG